MTGGEVLRFGYARGIAPMVHALVALAVVEAGLAHLLVALLWSPAAALVLTLATGSAVVWLVRSVRSFDRLPVLVEPDRVVLRVGTIRGVTVRRDDIAGVRETIDRAEAKRRDTLKLSLLAHPNIVVDLARAIDAGRGRTVRAIAHRLDDPAGFRAALA